MQSRKILDGHTTRELKVRLKTHLSRDGRQDFTGLRAITGECDGSDVKSLTFRRDIPGEERALQQGLDKELGVATMKCSGFGFSSNINTLRLTR